VKCLFPITKIISYSFQPIDSKMYVLLKEKSAVIIDPNINFEAEDLLRKEEVDELIILLTHEHFDHISGVNFFKEKFNCRVIAIEQCANNLINIKKNASAHFNELIYLAYGVESNEKFGPYICEADIVFTNEYQFDWRGHNFVIKHTPGHSEGSVCIILDYIYLFSGDSLIKGKKVITRLPGGSRKEYLVKTLPFLNSLPEDMIIFPGHGEMGVLSDFMDVK